MLWLFYQWLLALVLLLAAPFLLAIRGRHYLQTLPGRLGRHPDGTLVRGGLWIHAVSVGEVGVAATFAQALPEDLPLIVTTVTPTGQSQAHAAFTNKKLAGRKIVVTYLPFDFAPLVRRFLDRFEPRAVIMVEGDYWPMVLRCTRQRQIPAAVINGRISERSFGRLKRVGRLNGPLFYNAVQRFGVQTNEDKERLQALGVDDPRILVTGNLKFDTSEPPVLHELESEIQRLAVGRAILVAGSTMKEEEEKVLDALTSLGNDRALLIIAPRHPERWDSVARLIEERGFALVRRSESRSRGADVLLLDSLGELAAIYRSASGAFIGGTLVPTGGHNPLEPARFGVPVVVGPSMHNFAEIAAAFNGAHAWRQVPDVDGLAETWKSWLAEPEQAAALGQRGQEIVEQNRGAVERTVEMVQPLILREAS